MMAWAQTMVFAVIGRPPNLPRWRTWTLCPAGAPQSVAACLAGDPALRPAARDIVAGLCRSASQDPGPPRRRGRPAGPPGCTSRCTRPSAASWDGDPGGERPGGSRGDRAAGAPAGHRASRPARRAGFRHLRHRSARARAHGASCTCTAGRIIRPPRGMARPGPAGYSAGLACGGTWAARGGRRGCHRRRRGHRAPAAGAAAAARPPAWHAGRGNPDPVRQPGNPERPARHRRRPCLPRSPGRGPGGQLNPAHVRRQGQPGRRASAGSVSYSSASFIACAGQLSLQDSTQAPRPPSARASRSSTWQREPRLPMPRALVFSSAARPARRPVGR